MPCTDIIEPLNPGTCSRDKPVRAVSFIPTDTVHKVQSATDIQTLGTKLNTAANTPQTNAVTRVRGFLPNRLTILPATAAPTTPPTAAIEEKRAAVLRDSWKAIL